jgi:hypothetical protein
MRTFVYPNPDDKTRVIVTSIIDDKLDPYETISREGFFLNEEDLPRDAHYWFECIEITPEKKLVINLTKARHQIKEKLRAERKPLLEALDIEFQRRMETSSKVDQAVVSEKKRLRGITQLADSCESLEDLKTLSCQKL